jgi:hypothetical protein
MKDIKRSLFRAGALTLWMGVGTTLIYLASPARADESVTASTPDAGAPALAPDAGAQLPEMFFSASKAPLGPVWHAAPTDGGTRSPPVQR